jgi:hypothetical protein
MIKIAVMLMIAGLCFVQAAEALQIGQSESFPGYSAKDILNRSLAPNGVYWIDPDLPGGNSPFMVYADMTTAGGGWTLLHDQSGTRLDMDGQSWAIDILAVNQFPGSFIRFTSSAFDAYYVGKYGESTPGSGWTIISGNPSELYNLSWAEVSARIASGQYSVYVREFTTTQYPEPPSVPEPATLLLLGIGLVGVTGVRRCKT